MRDRLDELIDQFHGNDRKFAEACFRHGVRRGQDEPFNFVDKVQPATAEEKWTPGDCPLCGHIAHGGECAHGRAMHHGSTCKCASLYPAPAEEKP